MKDRPTPTLLPDPDHDHGATAGVWENGQGVDGPRSAAKELPGILGFVGGEGASSQDHMVHIATNFPGFHRYIIGAVDTVLGSNDSVHPSRLMIPSLMAIPSRIATPLQVDSQIF